MGESSSAMEASSLYQQQQRPDAVFSRNKEIPSPLTAQPKQIEKTSSPIDEFEKMVNDLFKTKRECDEYFAKEKSPANLKKLLEDHVDIETAREAARKERDRMLELSIVTEKRIKELSDHGEFQF